MTPMHQPMENEIVKVNHSVVLDGTDVDITRIVEYIEYEWSKQWNSLLNITQLTFDLGHDTIMFATESVKVSLLKYVTKISELFPNLFIMYEYYTEQEEDMEHAVFYLYKGQVTIDKNHLSIDNED